MAELMPEATSDAPSRRRTFGPLLYSTLLAAALIGLYSAIELGGPAVQRWLEGRRIAAGLSSPDANERRAAIGLLRTRDHESALSYLRQALKDPDPEVRADACEGLYNGGEEPARYVDALIGLVGKGGGDDRIDSRLKAIQILWMMRGTPRGPWTGSRNATADADVDRGAAIQRPTFEALSPLLDDPSSEIRSAAATALGTGGPRPEASARLEAAAEDRDPVVRLSVANSLMQLRGGDDPVAARLLLRLVDDLDALDHIPFAVHLRQAGEATRDRVFTAVIEAARKLEPEARLQRIAMLAGAGPGARAAVPALETLLDHPDLATRAAAADAILWIQNEGPFENSPGMGSAGPVELARITGPRTSRAIRAVLIEAVGGKELPSDSRQGALVWLQRMAQADPGALAEASASLVRQLGDPDLEVRRTAHMLLGLAIEEAPVRFPDSSTPKPLMK
ncbi:HEAT repeat domain-containing protein [Aquisphaera insulae]|uniref:HEAT repeat domain-containing protein n=1 Tax=Aquisphaera insulae TaxID=2712864 RepID=UPI0013EB5949|nr:HEAT repeat domain-containing protein [Aquisphaera insulae]